MEKSIVPSVLKRQMFAPKCKGFEKLSKITKQQRQESILIDDFTSLIST